MKFGLKLLLLYVLLILVIGYAFVLTLNHFKADYLIQRTTNQQTAYSAALQSNRLMADTFFNEIINQPAILKLVQRIVSSEGAEQKKNRGLLYRSLAATYNRTKGDVAEILHFHFPDNRSMLRFHLPSVSGDDLTIKRPSIQLCNSLLHEVHGYENGVVSHGYRHVYPLFYQNKHIGSVEVSHPYPLIYQKVQQLETAIQSSFVFFQDKELVARNLFNSELQNYSYEELSPGLVRQKHVPQLYTSAEAINQLSDETISILEVLKHDPQTQQNLSQHLDFSQYIESVDGLYSVVFYAIKNVSGEASGYLLGITPEPQVGSMTNRFMVAFILIALALFGGLLYRWSLQSSLIEKKKNRKSLQAFFDNKLVAMVQLNPEGNYTQCNRQWELMTGYNRDELLGMNYNDLTHPEDRNKKSLLPQLAESYHHHALELTKRYVRKNGTIFWANLSATGLYSENEEFIGLVGMITDISDMKLAEEQIRNSQMQLSQALKGAKCGLWDWNLAKNTLSFDDNYYLIAGYQPGDFPEHFEEWKKRIHPDDVGAVLTIVQSYLSGEIDAFSIEFRFKRKDDTWMWMLSQGEIIERADDGTPTRTSGLHVDIDERKQAEIERLELETQLRQKFKMEAVGTMAGGIAHNFNNNLAIILGNVELSQLKANNPEINGLLSNAKIAIMRSRDLVSQIMTYSRKGSPSLNPLQLPLIIDETLKLLGSTIPSTIQLNQTISPDSYHATINADASQIQEILLNLYGNAVHAMDEKGELDIILDVVGLTEKDIPDPDKHKPGRYAKIAIQDTGCGMTAEVQEKIFDPFFTTKEMYEGTGMGLSTVQGIIEQHKGLMKVESIVGQGTTFELYFPVIEQTKDAQPIPAKADIPRGSEKILFVDDDEMLAKLGELTLSELGYEVSTMTESPEALKFFAANADYFDLVITDQTMPDLTGKELIQELLKIRPDIPTIICTGFSSKVNEEEAGELGAKAFVMKPLDLQELAQTVRRVLDGKLS